MALVEPQEMLSNRGSKEASRRSRSCQMVVGLDRSNKNGSAYAVLSKLDSEVPGLFGGNRSAAITSLEKALDIGPDNSLAKLFLAEAYLKEDRDDEARRLPTHKRIFRTTIAVVAFHSTMGERIGHRRFRAMQPRM